MKNGDIVKIPNGKVGMIIARKGNHTIWVSTEHYHLSLTLHPEFTRKERLQYLRDLSAFDGDYSSDQLQLHEDKRLKQLEDGL